MEGLKAAVSELVVKTVLAAEPAMRSQQEELQAACSAASDGIKPPENSDGSDDRAAAGCATTVEQHCFEMFGFDVLIDEDLSPWLIEVNTSPSMECASPLDMDIKTSVLSDLLNVVGVTCSHDATGAGVAWDGSSKGAHIDAQDTATAAARASLEAELSQFSAAWPLSEGTDGSTRGMGLTDAERDTIRGFEDELLRSQGGGARSIYPVCENVARHRQLWDGTHTSRLSTTT